MEIVWDEPKRLANLDKHGFDFAELTEAWFLNAETGPVKRGRFMSVGHWRSEVVAVVYARYGTEAYSVISMRPAGRKERRQWP